MVASVAVGALTLAVADLALTGRMSDEIWALRSFPWVPVDRLNEQHAVPA
jgi:hypothetical protein